MNNIIKGFRTVQAAAAGQSFLANITSRFHVSSNKSLLFSRDDLKNPSSPSSATASSAATTAGAQLPPIKKLQQSPFSPLSEPHPRLAEFVQQAANNIVNNPTSTSTTTSTTTSTSTTSQTQTTTQSSLNFNRADTTTLPNGIRVISQQTNENACAVGLYIRCGTKYETPDNRGVFNLLEKMTFKGTKNESTADIVQKYETVSNNAMASSSKDIMQISVEVLRKDVEYIMRSFADQITCPLFQQEEFDEKKMDAMRSFDMLLSSPDAFLPEILHQTAYGDKDLGHTTFAKPEEYQRITTDTLRQAMQNYFIGKNIVVSATGIEHKHLVAYVEKYFSHIPYAAPLQTQQQQQQPLGNSDVPQYIGGTNFIMAEPKSEQAYYLAFPFKGLRSLSESKELLAGFVLQSLLGGGRDYSTGGPGKGMQSRLNLNVVYRLQQVKVCSAFFNVYSNTSLFGVHVSTDEGYLIHALYLVLEQLLGLRRLITDEEVERAKRQQKSMILMNLELRNVLCDDMARQLVSTGIWRSPEEICSGMDALTKDDILRFLDNLLLTNPTVVGFIGDKDKALSSDDIKKVIRSGKFK
ncbi:hypothetical protein SAMD00019534_029990 [Acytostelium subglobosum LB1]|uniref:hypothetical protein n=1 Tax=Acytostelium subglobosum LB1 TaxID=1410327 RepID=UPI0006448EA0|nr:hypothetical protein SAMD00019534_029990 [Acytostelium subglobosum LB1]GAM19824.1 hypothetical protein SAMD00019534_029990 [Acytostelium subglobosum LB1]|eukprot:XP_012756586.1 hypothetical protein SAMD00019534_029990 [Acytostelium subglobosum LB1]